ncbi:hypothetical protein XELAEV_18023035mg [Xenopus laevis]|uniref:Uncharacterized protein n=1 Tax=Xenopus laevis TaxID=8355 RepID=A0A974HNX9_XENLA|nr:hypothetical protein XELAEV_18023035mg [Xenopus laevis]
MHSSLTFFIIVIRRFNTFHLFLILKQRGYAWIDTYMASQSVFKLLECENKKQCGPLFKRIRNVLCS